MECAESFLSDGADGAVPQETRMRFTIPRCDQRAGLLYFEQIAALARLLTLTMNLDGVYRHRYRGRWKLSLPCALALDDWKMESKRSEKETALVPVIFLVFLF